ncbi:MAG: nucleotidyltransferase domain-containing protein [Candidatus Aenigmarchaeota archaeon]|nr:nucleotidyltransferase domain-containing protein [Candidatus Aenigmarchaeota archaeon]
MLVDIVLGSKSAWRVLSVLTEAPGQGITKEDIKKITKLGGNSIFNAVNILLKNDIILAKKVGKRTYYKINLTNNYSILIKDILDLERKNLNGLNPKIVILLREFTRLVNEAIDPKSIYVFGSVVKSSYTEDSDVDIAVVLNKMLETKERIEIEKINERLEKRFGMEIQAHFFMEKEFKQAEDTLVEQVHRDGIKLL